jgi:PAS domain S-box-containing protein
MPTEPIQILIVEDNPGDLRIVCEMVREAPHLVLHPVDSLAAGIRYLLTERVDVILLDLGLPDSQGLATLAAIIEADATVPVVVLTGRDDEAFGQEAVRNGAQDYLVKGRVVEHALTRAVRYALERHEVQARLMEDERRYRLLAENLPFIVSRFDREFRYLYVNPVVERITGLKPAAFLGKTDEELGMPTALAELWREKLQRVFESAETEHLEFEFPSPQGARAFSTTIVPELGKQGELETALSVSVDVTERKQMERETREQLHELRAWHEAMLGREDRVISLKQEVNELLARLGEPQHYLGGGP